MYTNVPAVQNLILLRILEPVGEYYVQIITKARKCDINVKEYRNAGLVQNKNTRVAKYLIPVIIVSVILNIPKFLETSVAYDEETGEVISHILFLNILFLWRRFTSL